MAPTPAQHQAADALAADFFPTHRFPDVPVGRVSRRKLGWFPPRWGVASLQISAGTAGGSACPWLLADLQRAEAGCRGGRPRFDLSYQMLTKKFVSTSQPCPQADDVAVLVDQHLELNVAPRLP